MPVSLLFSVLLLSAFNLCPQVEPSSPEPSTSLPAVGNGVENRIDRLTKELHKPVSGYVMVVAHRGAWRNAPENSVLALRHAIDLGVDMVEVDVRKTKDGVLVLMHDQTLDRTTNGSGRVDNYTWRDLKELQLRSGSGSLTSHRIPTFDEIMLIAKEEGKVLINVDKASGYFREVGEALKRTNTSHLAVVKSNLDPQVTRRSVHYVEGAHVMPVFHLNRRKDPLEKTIETYVENLNPRIMEVSFQKDTSLLFENPGMLTGRGVKIWNTTTSPNWCGGHDDTLAVESEDPESSWGWLIDHGATILMTDRPKELIEYLESRGRRN